MKRLIRRARCRCCRCSDVAGRSPQSGRHSTPRVRAWRAQHEPQILRELFDLVAIPNVASDKADIARNAQALTRMFEKRRFLPETIATAGRRWWSPSGKCRGAPRTLTFYFHYDGQPVEAREWTHAPPFSPVIVTDPGAVRPDA